MSDLRPKGTKIKLDEKEYGLRFTLNVIDEIQDHFDIPISQIDELFKDEKKQIKALKYIITLLINEDLDCIADETGIQAKHLKEDYVGRHINLLNAATLVSSIYNSFTSGMPAKGEDSDEDPNLTSEQQKN